MTEQQLILQFQSGQTDLFVKLYDSYVQKIYRFIYFKIQHKQTAEDLTGDTFFKAFEHLKTFDLSKGSFKTWIYKIARNTVIDYFRSVKEIKNIEDILDLHDAHDFKRDIEVKIKIEKIEQTLKKLDAKQREILVLRLWEDLKFKEIAEITGRSEASLKMSFRRSLELLKKSKGAVYLFLLINF